jgi:mediator of RNA polymerase II transcription subunit 6
MNKFMSIAEKLSDFSPSLGHTYLPPNFNRRKTADSLNGQHSKENTPMPDSLNVPKKALTTSKNLHSVMNESLGISERYDEEYMDDYPVTGQPGNFHLATKGRVEANKLMVPPAVTRGPLTVPAKPAPLKTDIPPARKDSKSGKSPKTPGTAGIPKPKRKKSKAPATGSVSPTS